jgi:hypothetical protein
MAAAQRVVFSLAIAGLAIAIGMVAAPLGAARAQDNRGTAEQQMACTPDVMRLCGAQIPDVDRIVACLRENTAQLSGPCRAVFEPANSPPQQTARTRGRVNQPRPQYDAGPQRQPQYDAVPQRRPPYDDDE